MNDKPAAPAPEPVAIVDYLVRAETNHSLRYMVEAPHQLRKGQPLYAHPAPVAAPAPEPPLYTISRGSDGRATVTTTPAPDLIALVNQQAEDEGLWFVAQTAPEAYLQAALRKLHAAIEGEQEE